MSREPLQANDGYTSAELIDDNIIELTSMMCDIRLTREEIAELATRFPVLQGPPAGGTPPAECPRCMAVGGKHEHWCLTLQDEGIDPVTPAIDVDWDEGGKVHNWRNHVLARTRRLWDTFTDEQRAAIMADAEELAGREEWE